MIFETLVLLLCSEALLSYYSGNLIPSSTCYITNFRHIKLSLFLDYHYNRVLKLYWHMKRQESCCLLFPNSDGCGASTKEVRTQ